MATTDDPVRPEPHDAFPVDNPVQALMRDHDLVRKLADTYQNTQSGDAKKQAATQLVQAIHTHSRLEEGVFYPFVKEATQRADIIEEALVEHGSAKDLLGELERRQGPAELGPCQ